MSSVKQFEKPYIFILVELKSVSATGGYRKMNVHVLPGRRLRPCGQSAGFISHARMWSTRAGILNNSLLLLDGHCAN